MDQIIDENELSANMEDYGEDMEGDSAIGS
jgi:hypothetical protein